MADQLEVDDAIGKATAALALHYATIVSLMQKGFLTQADAAEISAVATVGVREVFGLSPQAMQLAASSIDGFAAFVSEHATKH